MASKPPFATDEPDSYYESSPAPTRRIRQPAPPNPNDRSSAYNVYDNYLDVDHSSPAKSSDRYSGVGALGMGLLNMSDSDDDSDDDTPRDKNRIPPVSKNATLAAATVSTSRFPPTSPPRAALKPAIDSTDQPLLQPSIAAPRPGYAAPIAALNLAHPENVSPRIPPPKPKPLDIPTLENPFEPTGARLFVPGVGPIPTSPSPSISPSSPHPLQPSITPITPVFARPAKSPGGVTFSEPIPRNKPIMRGNSEGTLLPGRGEKGDDFWRRFSMVAKMENKTPAGSKESRWLKKTQNGTTRLSRWVWVIAVVLVLSIVGASVLGYFASKNKPDHQAPTAIGGSANERPVTTSSIASAAASSLSTIKHVSPTHTVARRGASQPTPTLGHVRATYRRKRLFKASMAH